MTLDDKDRYRMQNLRDRYEQEHPDEPLGYAELAAWICENCPVEVEWLLEQMLIEAASPVEGS